MHNMSGLLVSLLAGQIYGSASYTASLLLDWIRFFSQWPSWESLGSMGMGHH
jgi:hypothetical protein